MIEEIEDDCDPQGYLEDLIADAKAHPSIEPGMHVAVYHHMEGRPFLGFGVILETWWSNFYSQYCAVIKMIDGTLETNVMACNLERTSRCGSTQYALMKQRTVKGGRDGLV